MTVEEQLVPHPLRVAAALSWRVLVVVTAIALMAVVLATLRLIFLPTIVALLLATALVPPTRWLRARGVPSAAATAGVLVAAVLMLAGVISAVATLAVVDFAEFEGLRASVDEGVDRVKQWLVESPLGLSEAEVDARFEQAREQVRSSADRLAGGAFSGALIVVEMIAGGALTLVLLFYFVHDGRGMWRWVVRLFPEALEPDVEAIGERGWRTLTGYLRGTIAVAAFDAVAIAIVLVILNVPFAVPLTLLIFFGAFIPVVGAFLTGFVAVMVALASEGAVTALIVLGAIVLVQQLEGNVLAPLLLGRSVRLHPVVVVLAVTAGGTIWGIPGAFVAVPITALIAATVTYLVARGRDLPPEQAAVVDPGDASMPGGDAGAHPDAGDHASADAAAGAAQTLRREAEA